MKKDEPMKIIIVKDGPYEVSGGVRLNQAIIKSDEHDTSVTWKEGCQYEGHAEPYFLCRCGHSARKPYCDGWHNAAGYHGCEHNSRPPYDERAKVEPGPRIKLMDDKSLCAVARFCDRGATIWRLVEMDDDEAVKLAIEESCACPSGRLTVVDDEGKRIEPTLPAEISAIQDPVKNCRGPLWVKGGIEIRGEGGEKYETRNRVTLCRCGASKNQPYCDASHYETEEMQGLDEEQWAG